MTRGCRGSPSQRAPAVVVCVPRPSRVCVPPVVVCVPPVAACVPPVVVCVAAPCSVRPTRRRVRAAARRSVAFTRRRVWPAARRSGASPGRVCVPPVVVCEGVELCDGVLHGKAPTWLAHSLSAPPWSRRARLLSGPRLELEPPSTAASTTHFCSMFHSSKCDPLRPPERLNFLTAAFIPQNDDPKSAA